MYARYEKKVVFMEISNYINAPYNKSHDNVLFKYRKSNFKCFY